jgi:uracil-DNA glycosylase
MITIYKDIEIDESWYELLKDYFLSSYFRDTMIALEQQWRVGFTIFPDKYDIFHAYNSTSIDKVKVVIIGQDPYHTPGHAHGLAFSTLSDKIPPSLKNIFKELDNEGLLSEVPSHGNLQYWADQGVLLLNSILTVEERKPLSHNYIGWKLLTDVTIHRLSNLNRGIIFLLWGNYAQTKEMYIDKSTNYILKTSHPSPFSARFGFFGCNHFIKTNILLEQQGKEPIIWQI